MRILLIGYEKEIENVISLISDKYIYSENDIVETCIWNDIISVRSLLINKENIYDWYIVVVNTKHKAEEICVVISEVFGISVEKIINYSAFYEVTMPYMHVDKIMKIPNIHYDGMILGISHAEVGIIPELLNGEYVNLAVSSQDLYYNLKTLEYCISQYPDRISGLKHLIIDLFDYTYFNYDVSKSKTFIQYLNWGGYHNDKHNFEVNKNYDYKYEDVMDALLSERYRGISNKKIDMWIDLFEDIHQKDFYKGYTTTDNICCRNRIITDKDVEEYRVGTPIQVMEYADTIEENKSIFIKLLEAAKAINHELRITCLLLPQYYKAQNKAELYCSKWKNKFYSIINWAKEKYDFEFIDLKQCDISKRAEYFYDASHLNYAGAIMFSQFLAGMLDDVNADN